MQVGSEREKIQLFILQGLPGVGPERVRCLLERFGSVERVITARSDELASVDGIGERVATFIRRAVS